jgi:hypothetical protein
MLLSAEINAEANMKVKKSIAAGLKDKNLAPRKAIKQEPLYFSVS